MASDPDSAAGPRSVYVLRQQLRQQTADQLARRYDRLGLARVGVVLAGLVLAGLIFFIGWLSVAWLAVPAVLFLILMYLYDRTARRLHRARRAVRFYARGLERLDGRWAGRGEQGQRYLNEQHLYAQDLDLFGPGSLFELLCTVRSRPGEDTLAGWFLAPAPAAEVRARQEAVAELTPRLDLREDVALLGAEVPPVDFAPLAAWGAAPPVLHQRGRLRLLAVALALANTATLIAGIAGYTTYSPFLIALILSALATRWVQGRVRQVLGAIEPMYRELVMLSGLLGRLEQESFTSPRLSELRSALDVDGTPTSRQIAELVVLVDWLNSRHNLMFAPLAFVLLWPLQMALSLEKWRIRSGRAIARWVEAAGVIEALSAFAGYAYENPEDTFPEVVEGPARFEAVELGHPLLPRQRCVRNDVRLGMPAQLLVVSGSNMSGKSTLLRAVGVNAVLALAGAPVHARRLQLTSLALGATLRVQDSLLEGRSRFFADITRVRRILEAAQRGPVPMLFLLDELFHGTNSHDRGIGAEAVLRRLLDAGAIGLVTTHDLALTQLTERLAPRAVNVHFADQLVNGELHFDYRMHPGVVPHSNALALMRAIGLDV